MRQRLPAAAALPSSHSRSLGLVRLRPPPSRKPRIITRTNGHILPPILLPPILTQTFSLWLLSGIRLWSSDCTLLEVLCG